MKLNKFLIGFGLGGLIATYICEWVFKKYDTSSQVIKLQSEVIHIFYDELIDAYHKIKKLERMEQEEKNKYYNYMGDDLK